jgi:hypothetical protein
MEKTMGVLKTIVRIGIVTVAVVGVGVLIAGPHRVGALWERLRGAVGTAIDEHIDDPTALRTQLRTLESQYPERITDLRGDLAQLVEQRRQMERDRAVAERVVALADRDLAALKPLLAQAETARASAGPGQLVTVRFDQDVLPLDQAQKRAGEIAQTRSAYTGRARDAARDLSYMGQQQERLQALLAQLETERADFQAQLWQLDRQVDSIARNDRLIELMQKRQKTIDECSRYEAGNLDQVQAHMAEVRSRQEAELELLAHTQDRLDYEDQARGQLDDEGFPLDLGGFSGAPYEGAPLDGPALDGAPLDGAAGNGAPSGGGPVEGAGGEELSSARGEVLVEQAAPRPR